MMFSVLPLQFVCDCVVFPLVFRFLDCLVWYVVAAQLYALADNLRIQYQSGFYSADRYPTFTFADILVGHGTRHKHNKHLSNTPRAIATSDQRRTNHTH